LEKNKIVGASLFSSAGIAEFYFEELGIDVLTANELLPKRARLYEYFHPKTNMICGSITDPVIFEKIDKQIKATNAKFLIATPPCQGMSTLGKKEYNTDKRNFLVFYVLEIIDRNDFDYILIENVPKFLNLFFPFNESFMKLEQILNLKYSDKYIIEKSLLNASDFGVPQSRPRGFYRIYKKGLNWPMPSTELQVTLKDAIGNLPKLEAGESSNIKWHFAKKHNEREILSMRHTPPGKSALLNEIHYPKKVNGERIKGFHNTFKRMTWDQPCHARTMNSGNIGGHNNVHPGRLLEDGTYSDARVLTLRELFIVSSLPPDLDLPNWVSDSFIREVIGEAIPPLFSKKIVLGISSINQKRSN
jgi:DNA (cytosine-5)-methyltransferase 1